MKEETGVYETNFQSVIRAVQTNRIKTAKQANAAMAPYKDNIHRMEAEAMQLAEEGNRRTNLMEPALNALTARVTWFIVLLALAATGASGLIGTFLTRSITLPVQEIAAMARQIAKGDIEQKVEMERKDEIGVLADSFRDMVA